MVSAGDLHTVFLCSDGTACAVGRNARGQCNLPSQEGNPAVQVSAGQFSTVVVFLDGTARSSVGNAGSHTGLPVGVPVPHRGIAQASAGWGHNVYLLRSGWATAWGDNTHGQCEFPERAPRWEYYHGGLDERDQPGVYVQVSAGAHHTALLRNDGRAEAVGMNSDGQCRIPAPEADNLYTQVSAGVLHTVLLRQDGTAIAVGCNSNGQCSLPEPPAGAGVVQVSAGLRHTVLLLSDGRALAVGENRAGQCRIPELPEGTSYAQVSAGTGHTALLRSDGRAVLIGRNRERQCTLPELEEGVFLAEHREERAALAMALEEPPAVLVQLFGRPDEARQELEVTGLSLAGKELAKVTLPMEARAEELLNQLAKAVDRPLGRLRSSQAVFLLPDRRSLKDCDHDVLAKVFF